MYVLFMCMYVCNVCMYVCIGVAVFDDVWSHFERDRPGVCGGPAQENKGLHTYIHTYIHDITSEHYKNTTYNTIQPCVRHPQS